MIAMSDLFRVSLRQVVRQRGFGVILSIALGITAFIALSVLGQEIRYKVGQDMVLMGGVNIIRVYMDDAQYPGQPRRDFSPRTVEALRKIPGVGMISENIRNGVTFSLRASGERTLGVHFIGVDQYFAETYSLELVAGRMLSTDDVRGHRRVCMLGREAATNLYGDPSLAVGKLLFLGKDVIEVVGVVTGVMLGEWNQGGFLPTTVMEDRNWARMSLSEPPMAFFRPTSRVRARTAAKVPYQMPKPPSMRDATMPSQSRASTHMKVVLMRSSWSSCVEMTRYGAS